MPTKPAFFRSKFAAPPASDDAVRGSSSSRGYDAAWNRLRNWFITQPENVVCFAPGCGRLTTIVDHIVPIAIDPSRRLDPSNLRGCCGLHHARLTANYRTHGINELPKGSAQ